MPQAVASIVHGNDVDVEIIKRKGEDDTDHVQFAITDKKRKRTRFEREESTDHGDSIKKSTGAEKRRRSRSHQSQVAKELVSEDSTKTKNLQKEETAGGQVASDEEKEGDRSGDEGEDEYDDEGDEEEEQGSSLLRDLGEFSEEMAMMSLENKISPLTFCHAFPFHLVFDRDLNVRQVSHFPFFSFFTPFLLRFSFLPHLLLFRLRLLRLLRILLLHLLLFFSLLLFPLLHRLMPHSLPALPLGSVIHIDFYTCMNSFKVK